MPEPDVKARPSVFNGALVLNQRSLRSALDNLNAEKNGKAAQSLGAPDLINLCLLLESIAFSNQLYVDGTLPPQDLALLDRSLDLTKRASGCPVAVSQIHRTAEDLKNLFQESAETAGLLIHDSLHALDSQKDKPLEEDVDEFCNVILDSAGQPRRLREERAAIYADAASRGVDTFRGSKCAAGIMTAELEDLDLLETVAFHLRAAPADRSRKIVAVLINRFRINYVNSLAASKKAAYLADMTIEDLRSAQVIIFWRYLAKKIAERHSIHLTPETRSAFDSNLSAAPLGFAILLNTRGNSPHDLVKEAFSIRDQRFAKRAAGMTAQDRYMHEMDANAFANFQDYLYKSKWVELHNHSEREKFSKCWWREIKLPFVAGVALGAYFGVSAHGSAAIVAAFHAGGEILGEILNHAAEKTGRGGGIQVEQYRKLDGYLQLAADNDRLGVTLSEQVNRLFKRGLTL